MSKKKVVRAAYAGGGIVMRPPIDRSAASAVLQSDITVETWGEIEAAFADYGRKLRASQATPSNLAEGGWNCRQSRASKAIDTAMKEIESARSRHGDFLHEASENYSLEVFGHSAYGELDADNLLNDAYDKLLKAVCIIERATPMNIETPTPATAKRELFRAIKSALEKSGLACSLSSGHSFMRLPEGPSENDLTPFEQLICALDIHEAVSPQAASKWMQRTSAGTD